VNVAGVEAVEVLSDRARLDPLATFLASAKVHDDQVLLYLFTDEETGPYQPRELGARWCHWLSRVLLRIRPRSPENRNHAIDRE
jgi:hypothetical protein